MKGLLPIIVGLLVSVESFGAGLVQYRDFLSKDGKAIRGRVLRYDARKSKVTIERDNRKVFTVPIFAFSDDDQEYILRWELNKVFLDDGDFKIDAKRKKFDEEKGSGSTFYGYSIDSRETETFGYEITLENRSTSPLEGLKVDYCIFYEQENSGNGKTIDEEGVRCGTLDVASLRAKSSKELLTEPVSIYTYELDADWVYADGRDNKISGDVRGVWVRVTKALDNGEVLTRDFCMPDSLSNSKTWTTSSVHVGRNK